MAVSPASSAPATPAAGDAFSDYSDAAPSASDASPVAPGAATDASQAPDGSNSTSDASPPTAPAVGPRIRALREAAGVSLRGLAERTGVSAPMLSQVERGETSPTLAVAAKIAAGLELSLSQLLRLDEGGHVVVVRQDERRRVQREGHRFEELTPPLPGQRAEVSIHTLDAGAATGGSGDPPIHEPGARETAIVDAGALTLVVDGERHALAAGDSVTFDADLPHHFVNEGPDAARFVAVVAAGLRRS